MQITKLGAALALTAALGGCAGGSMGTGMGTKELVGTAAGAALGGWIGSNLASGGKAELATTAAGVFIGGLIGNQIGRSMDDQDRAAAQRAEYEALERNPDGRYSRWDNPNNGNYGYTRPDRTYQADSGEYCREYQTTVVIDGRPQSAYGTACRMPDGSWKVVG